MSCLLCESEASRKLEISCETLIYSIRSKKATIDNNNNIHLLQLSFSDKRKECMVVDITVDLLLLCCVIILGNNPNCSRYKIQWKILWPQAFNTKGLFGLVWRKRNPACTSCCVIISFLIFYYFSPVCDSLFDGDCQASKWWVDKSPSCL